MVRGGKGKGPGAWQSSAAYQTALTKIVKAREAAGLTQRDLAEALGKLPSWVGKIESKERRLDLIEFIAVARALRLKEVELLRTISADLPKRIEI
jgi:transcriptional regulator with XRE-family HTH domain